MHLLNQTLQSVRKLTSDRVNNIESQQYRLNNIESTVAPVEVLEVMEGCFSMLTANRMYDVGSKGLWTG